MDELEFESNQYSKNKLPTRTYVGPAVNVKNPDGTPAEKRYVTKVFDIEDFQEFYKDLKNKKILKVLREGQRQEVVAIVDKDTRSFSLRLQRFTRDTGAPHCQSFSFHGGALIKLIEFIDSLGFIDFSDKSYFKLEDRDIQKQKQFWLQNQDLVSSLKRFDKNLLTRIFSKIEDQQRLKVIIDSLSNIEIKNLGATIKQTSYKKSLEDFEQLLALEEAGNIVVDIEKYEPLKKYKAGKPEDIFRKWLESNLWVFGVEYYKKHDWRIIADDAVADLVMETADGFIDLIELKRPKLPYRLFIPHSNHSGYYPSSEFSKAFGQCLLYLQRLDEKKNAIEDKRTTKVLRPRIKLVIGRTKDFSPEEFSAMRILNANLNSISVVTYDDLLRNGKQIVDYYEHLKM